MNSSGYFYFFIIVWQKAIPANLPSFGFELILFNLILSFLLNQPLSIRTDPFPNTSDVPKGGILSPLDTLPRLHFLLNTTANFVLFSFYLLILTLTDFLNWDEQKLVKFRSMNISSPYFPVHFSL